MQPSGLKGSGMNDIPTSWYIKVCFLLVLRSLLRGQGTTLISSKTKRGCKACFKEADFEKGSPYQVIREQAHKLAMDFKKFHKVVSTNRVPLAVEKDESNIATTPQQLEKDDIINV